MRFWAGLARPSRTSRSDAGRRRLDHVDPTDPGRRLLALTAGGRDMIQDLTQTGAAIGDRFLQALDPTDRQELHRILLALVPPPPDPAADR